MSPEALAEHDDQSTEQASSWLQRQEFEDICSVDAMATINPVLALHHNVIHGGLGRQQVLTGRLDYSFLHMGEQPCTRSEMALDKPGSDFCICVTEEQNRERAIRLDNESGQHFCFLFFIYVQEEWKRDWLEAG